MFGNGNSLLISSIGPSLVANGLHLCVVLVVPRLTKNLLPISNLNHDNDVDVVFSKSSFSIEDRIKKH